MIKVEGVTKKFGEKTAVNNASFEVKAGEIFGFLGPNGAGKTTTIKMIVGLLRPDTGKITVSGIDVVDESIESKKKFAYVPDNPDIYENMTAYQYINFMANVYNVTEEDRKKRTEELATLFEIQDDLNDYLKGFSHGMKQKVALIAALISDPDVLILDEPMVGLDAKSAFNLKNLMKKRCERGKSVFLSTHVMEVAEKICDRIAIIKKGDIIANGSLDELRGEAGKDESLEELFLELTE